MDPLNNMCDALVCINNILQRRKQNIGDSSIEFTAMKKDNNQEELPIDSSFSFGMNNSNRQISTMSELKSIAVTRRNENHSLHLESLTKDNFHRVHICNRSIDELPNINDYDIKRLKLINVYTIQDLLGRYLIHNTPDEFYTFLIKTYQLSENAASTITQLFYQWTRHNLDGIADNQRSDEMNIMN